MSDKKILILEKGGGAWGPLLRDYFGDAPVSVILGGEPSQAAPLFDRSRPRVLFVEASFLSRAFLQKIRVRKNTDPLFRVFLLREDPAFSKEPFLDAIFPASPASFDLNKRFVDALPVRELVRLLVVDDEPEIGAMVRDYFEGRKAPSFEIQCVPNGREAFDAIARRKPDVIILDIKMPVMDGREFYAKLKASKVEMPVIVFFDSISGEELSEMRRSGNPAVIEKGFKGSSLSAMMLLVKKLVYFNT